MAIASGMPVPAIYVQDEEPGINSFAAGMGLNDAVIVVTRGALEALDRDELQAIIAHEFSHIRNGDILLNTRLAAAMTGLLMIAELAELLHYDINRPNASRINPTSHAANKPSAIAAGCRVLGYGGVFFGELLKAAVNRQRETLADASAVQFTRHPEALARALKKVAGHPYASLMFHPNSRAFSHLFFAQGLD
ncbi:MAG: M48 family metalloprotease, partial [Aeromonadaceae bacterium]